MKQVSRIISTYTADVSGVCSALFELGGMTIMHDASGCNSTYNTHDEPRWYDQDSLVFISALTEIDAIMGNDEKLVRDIADAAVELKPNFIAITGTPIPMMMGTDLPAVAQMVEKRTGIPAFGFDTNGMHSYVVGAGKALEKVVSYFAKEYEKEEKTINILGATPLDFTMNGMLQTMKQALKERGWQINSTVAMDTDFEEICTVAKASVNLVVSYVGMPLAKALQKRFGTPFVVATPYYGLADDISADLQQAMDENRVIYSAQRRIGGDDFVLIGESVTMTSLAWAIEKEYGLKGKVISAVETDKMVLGEKDVYLREEEEIEQAIKNTKIVLADPLYKGIVSEESKFIGLGHEAFSGRIFRKEIPNLAKELNFGF